MADRVQKGNRLAITLVVCTLALIAFFTVSNGQQPPSAVTDTTADSNPVRGTYDVLEDLLTNPQYAHELWGMTMSVYVSRNVRNQSSGHIHLEWNDNAFDQSADTLPEQKQPRKAVLALAEKVFVDTEGMKAKYAACLDAVVEELRGRGPGYLDPPYEGSWHYYKSDVAEGEEVSCKAERKYAGEPMLIKARFLIKR
ncbi:MAG: hypothetical protein OYG31_03315 [Candidatus Kaiserbacteria bacterium]|nr:hypothetical protein [Candidatus Kaiserbacteria bacterium]